MEWELPHWLIVAGTLLVIAGLIGLLMKRRHQAKVQDDPTEQSSEPRPSFPRCRIFSTPGLEGIGVRR
jgi:hypothetical protein